MSSPAPQTMPCVSAPFEARRPLSLELPRFVARAVSALLVTAGLLLVVFHLWLFWHRWQAGGFSDPLVATRWIGSALLVAALLMARRRRFTAPRGRQALVVWTLVALVHVGANHPEVSDSQLSAPGVLFVVPSVAGAVLLTAAALVLARRRLRALVSRVPGAPSRAARPERPSAPFLASPPPLRAPPVGLTA